MECEKCGAEHEEGVETCPECGEPVTAAEQVADEASAAESTEPAAEETADAPAEAAVDEVVPDAAAADAAAADEGADEPAGDAGTDAFFADVPVEIPPADEAAAAGEAPSGGGKKWLLVVAGLIVLALLGGGGWYLSQKVTDAASPQASAQAMLDAYAAYDAAGILEVATHSTLPADGVKEFETQAAEAKKRAGGKPGVKDIKVGKVTNDSATQATVEVEANWLTDPAKGTYTKRTEKLTIVKQDGKWLVKLF
jgi:predicted  nucleic acid-binding Zn-ribbon protein